MDEMHETSSEDVHMEVKLVIELEEHSGKTHVHVRYVDKPEDMFFVNVALSDEAGIIEEVVLRTGLSSLDVKAALKYFQ